MFFTSCIREHNNTHISVCMFGASTTVFAYLKRLVRRALIIATLPLQEHPTSVRETSRYRCVVISTDVIRFNTYQDIGQRERD